MGLIYQLNDELGIERWKASSLGGLIICNDYLGNKILAEEYFNQTYEINTALVNDLYLSVGFKLMRQGNYDLSEKAFLEQLKIEKDIKNNKGIINTLTNIGLNYFYSGDYKNALESFNLAINHSGIENLVHTVETLAFKHICEVILHLPVKDTFLKNYIRKKMNTNETWYKNEPEYINWALYEYSGEIKYIIEAKRQLDLTLDKIKSDKVSMVSSYSMYRRILDAHKDIENS